MLIAPRRSQILALFVTCAAACAAASSADLDAHLDADGSYTLAVRGSPWLRSGATALTVNGTTYTSADGSLRVQDGSGGVQTISGSEPVLGAFSGTRILWDAGGTSFVTSVKVFAAEGAVIFEQSFPEGAQRTAPATGVDPKSLSNTALSAFPSFVISDGGDNGDGDGDNRFGFLTFSGRFLEASKAAPWSVRSTPPSGRSAGPLALFDANLTTVVISPASQFMAAVSEVRQHTSGSTGASEPTWAHGVMGSVVSLPKGFVLRTVARLGRGGGVGDAEPGISGAVKGWGDMLLRLYGKDADAARAADPTLHQLGYSTDNGAFYYGRPEPGKSMEQTLLDVAADARAVGAPVRTVLLDSWWYYKGIGGGVKNWTARPEIFPDGGMRHFQEVTGWRVQAHNRYWSADTDYAAQNGGGYDFIVEEAMAIPTEQRFWDDLMHNGTAWGLAVYEQDWLYNEFEGLNATQQNVTLGRDWLMQMGAGAAKVNVTVQYCMAYARMVLQSVEIPAVSQFRAGDDYGPGQSTGCGFPYCVYDIGTTSLVAWALGLAPAKDDFWTTAVQPGSPYGRGNATEPYNEMEAMIASYSTGPVQPSDSVGHMNGTLLRMTCAADGTLLQPSRPATTLDAAFAQAAFGRAGPVPTKSNNPAVWSTHTLVPGAGKYAHIIAIGLNATWSLAPEDLPLDLSAENGTAGGADYVAYMGYGTAKNVTLSGGTPSGGSFSASAPIVLKPCLYSDFALWHAAPRSRATGWALLGELSKWVPVAKQRVLGVSDAHGGISVQVAGVAGEEVALTFLDRANELHTATCAFGTNPGAGRPARGDGDGQEWLHAIATCDSAGCSCA